MDDKNDQILTIPNLLTLIRLLLIPCIVWSYLIQRDLWLTAALLIISGATDILDGYIARRFHMVSDLGKAMDPVADKLTQGITLILLITRHRKMLILVLLLAVKELVTGLMGLQVIRKTGRVFGAQWHGKATTVLLYCTMLLHLLWPAIPDPASNGMIMLCVVLMLVSMGLYLRRNKALLDASADP